MSADPDPQAAKVRENSDSSALDPGGYYDSDGTKKKRRRGRCSIATPATAS